MQAKIQRSTSCCSCGWSHAGQSVYGCESSTSGTSSRANDYEFSNFACATFLSGFFGDVSGVTTCLPGSRLTSRSPFVFLDSRYCGMQPRRVVPQFVDYEFSESFPLACPVSSAMVLELPRAYLYMSRVALFFVPSDSQYCGIQFFVDAIVEVQCSVTSWRLMWRKTQGHCFRYCVTPAG